MTTVTIIYKSGAKVHLQVESMGVTRFGTGATEVTWKDAKPKPLLMGVDEIAAIFEGKV